MDGETLRVLLRQAKYADARVKIYYLTGVTHEGMVHKATPFNLWIEVLDISPEEIGKVYEVRYDSLLIHEQPGVITIIPAQWIMTIRVIPLERR